MVFGTELSLFLNILHTIVIQSILGSVIIGLTAEKSKNVYKSKIINLYLNFIDDFPLVELIV